MECLRLWTLNLGSNLAFRAYPLNSCAIRLYVRSPWRPVKSADPVGSRTSKYALSSRLVSRKIGFSPPMLPLTRLMYIFPLFKSISCKVSSVASETLNPYLYRMFHREIRIFQF